MGTGEPPLPPARESCFLVFSQQPDARIDLVHWAQHASRFFDTHLALATPKRYGEVAPRVDSAQFVLSLPGAPPATLWALARPRESEDLALAQAAEARMSHTGLLLLAGRCPQVWLVAREPVVSPPGDSPSDHEALRLAAILASVLLGPILDARAGELFGVKTARAKLGS
jgi:hypothetical protein